MKDLSLGWAQRKEFCDELGMSATGTGGTVFVVGICCPDRAGWKDPSELVPPLGRRSRTQASTVSGVLEKCSSELLAHTSLCSAGGFWGV